MSKLLKKSWSWLLAATLAFTGVNALAENCKVGDTDGYTFEQAISAANSAEGNVKITLLTDCEITTKYTTDVPLYLRKSGTEIDLNEQTLTVANNCGFDIDKNVNGVYIHDGKITTSSRYLIYHEGGELKIERVTTAGGINCAAGTVEIVDCNVVCNPADRTYGGVCAQNAALVTINGGTYSSSTGEGYYLGSDLTCPIFIPASNPSAKIVVYDGTFTGPINMHSGTVELRGGRFNWCNPRILNSTACKTGLKIYGGTFDYSGNNGSRDNALNDRPDAMHYNQVATAYNFVQEGYKAVSTATAYVYDVRSNNDAQIVETGVGYPSLDDALAAVQPNQTIKLLGDVSYDASHSYNDNPVVLHGVFN